MTWLRLDDGFPYHPKIAVLTAKQFQLWVRILCNSARFSNPKLTKKTIRIVPDLTAIHIAKFVEVGLLDETEDGWEVHGWAKYQPKDPTAADRMRRYRDRNEDRNADRNENVTRARIRARSRPVLTSIDVRKGTNVDPIPRPPESAAHSAGGATCPVCNVNLAGPQSLAEHIYHVHDGPYPEHWDDPANDPADDG